MNKEWWFFKSRIKIVQKNVDNPIALETKLVGKYEITASYFSINVIILCIEQIERNE